MNQQPMTLPAVGAALSWATARSAGHAARRTVTAPFGAGAPGPRASAQDRPQADRKRPAPTSASNHHPAGAIKPDAAGPALADESSLARLLSLIERVVEVCP